MTCASWLQQVLALVRGDILYTTLSGLVDDVKALEVLVEINAPRAQIATEKGRMCIRDLTELVSSPNSADSPLLLVRHNF